MLTVELLAFWFVQINRQIFRLCPWNGRIGQGCNTQNGVGCAFEDFSASAAGLWIHNQFLPLLWQLGGLL